MTGCRSINPVPVHHVLLSLASGLPTMYSFKLTMSAVICQTVQSTVSIPAHAKMSGSLHWVSLTIDGLLNQAHYISSSLLVPLFPSCSHLGLRKNGTTNLPLFASSLPNLLRVSRITTTLWPSRPHSPTPTPRLHAWVLPTPRVSSRINNTTLKRRQKCRFLHVLQDTLALNPHPLSASRARTTTRVQREGTVGVAPPPLLVLSGILTPVLVFLPCLQPS